MINIAGFSSDMYLIIPIPERAIVSISILIVCNDQYTLDVLNKDLAGSGYNTHLESDIRIAAELSEEIGIFDVLLLCILHSNVTCPPKTGPVVVLE